MHRLSQRPFFFAASLLHVQGGLNMATCTWGLTINSESLIFFRFKIKLFYILVFYLGWLKSSSFRTGEDLQKHLWINVSDTYLRPSGCEPLSAYSRHADVIFGAWPPIATRMYWMRCYPRKDICKYNDLFWCLRAHLQGMNFVTTGFLVTYFPTCWSNLVTHQNKDDWNRAACHTSESENRTVTLRGSKSWWL